MPRNGIQLCYHYDEKRVEKFLASSGYVIGQPKLNGLHLRWENNQLFSSEGNPVTSIPHIAVELRHHFDGVDLEGEAYCHGMPLQDIRGIVGRTKNLHPDYDAIGFHVFDLIKPGVVQGLRIWDMVDLEGFEFATRVQMVPTKMLGSHEEIEGFLLDQVDAGYEGIVVRNLKGLWVPKRSTNVLKWKPTHHDTYTIKELIEGTGKYAGTLGAAEVADKDGNEFHLGSFAITDQERDHIWTHRDEYIGVKCQARYTEITRGGKPPSGVFEFFVDERGHRVKAA